MAISRQTILSDELILFDNPSARFCSPSCIEDRIRLISRPSISIDNDKVNRLVCDDIDMDIYFLNVNK